MIHPKARGAIIGFLSSNSACIVVAQTFTTMVKTVVPRKAPEAVPIALHSAPIPDNAQRARCIFKAALLEILNTALQKEGEGNARIKEEMATDETPVRSGVVDQTA